MATALISNQYSPYDRHAPLQHKVFRAMWKNPCATEKQIAEYLHLPYGLVRVTVSRLRKRKDYSRLCPNCFKPKFFNFLCQNCGYEDSGYNISSTAEEDLPSLQRDFNSLSAVYSIQPDRGLGSVTTYGKGQDYEGKSASLHLQNSPLYIKHYADPREDRRKEEAKSRLFEWLKTIASSEEITEQTARLFDLHWRELSLAAPKLVSSKYFADSVLDYVVEKLRVHHPELPRKIPPRLDTRTKKSKIVQDPQPQASSQD